ncbi:MAG: DUF1761 domain-containing protein [bacterium]|nr:DUF1761 domain-containing protein [bacterium]
MLQLNINYLAVLAAAGVAFALGMAWYSPMLFGKQWQKAIRPKDDQPLAEGWGEKSMTEMMKGKDMKRIFSLSFLGSVLMAFMLAQFIRLTGSTAGLEGALLGLWAAIGFVATTALSQVFYEGKSPTVFWITTSYHAVSLMLMGIVLAVWR